MYERIYLCVNKGYPRTDRLFVRKIRKQATPYFGDSLFDVQDSFLLSRVTVGSSIGVGSGASTGDKTKEKQVAVSDFYLKPSRLLVKLQ